MFCKCYTLLRERQKLKINATPSILPLTSILLPFFKMPLCTVHTCITRSECGTNVMHKMPLCITCTCMHFSRQAHPVVAGSNLQKYMRRLTKFQLLIITDNPSSPNGPCGPETPIAPYTIKEYSKI